MEPATSSYPVQLGFWVNQARGPVLGSTLTLTRSDGALLIAFIAFFVTVVGTQLWRVLCLVLFKIFSNAESQDALYNQRQAILRNSASPFDGVKVMLATLHAWRTSNPRSRPMRRILPLLIGTILLAVALTTASGLSSRIAQGNEVLINGSNCGIIKARSFIDDLSKLQTLWSPYITRQFERGSEYAQRCYESDSRSEGCDTFVRKSLPITIIRNASCPFDKPLCRSQDSNLILDTGMVDSQRDLGLNWPENSNFQMRHRLHCAPLNTDGYKSKYVWHNTTWTAYNYGDSTQGSGCNCTVALDEENLNPQIDKEPPTTQPNHDYSLDSYYSVFSKGSLAELEPDYAPLPGLSKHGGDLYTNLLFPGSMVFTEPSDDDWYRATTPITVTTTNNLGEVNYTMYLADEPVWPMGCVEQFEVCKQGTCTGLGPDMDTVEVVNNTLRMGSDFLGEGSYIRYIGPLSNLLKLLGKSSLASRFKAGNSISTAMKANDWHLDVIHWESTLLASIQNLVAEIASGPVFDDPELERFITRPNATERGMYCDSQIIRSDAYASFSAFGLFFVLVAGVLIIIASAIIEPIFALIDRRNGGYASVEWRANSALHIQHLALAVDNKDEWEVGAFDVPVTANQSKIATFKPVDRTVLPQVQTPSTNLNIGEEVQDTTPDSEVSNDHMDTPVRLDEKNLAICETHGSLNDSSRRDTGDEVSVTHGPTNEPDHGTIERVKGGNYQAGKLWTGT